MATHIRPDKVSTNTQRAHKVSISITCCDRTCGQCKWRDEIQLDFCNLFDVYLIPAGENAGRGMLRDKRCLNAEIGRS